MDHHSNSKMSDTQLVLFEQQPLDITAKLDNKDLLLVSLLEYIFVVQQNSNGLFKSICEYLQKSGILEDNAAYSPDSVGIRSLYINFINKIIQKTGKMEQLVPYLGTPIQSRYANDFIEIEKIGDGGFGTVFKALNKLDNTLYAIKKVPFRNADTSNQYLPFNEVRHLSQLNHPNIIRYHTTWIELERYIPNLFIQMELCPGNLRNYIDKRNYNENAINHDREMDKFADILDAVQYIHSKNIIHRDLNPNNILVDADGNVKIGDFGLSKTIEANERIHEDDSYGNMLYLAPEQLEHNMCSQKSDIYSLGIVLFELLVIFRSQMERCKVLKDLKEGVFDDPAIVELNAIKSMVAHNDTKRPTASEVGLMI